MTMSTGPRFWRNLALIGVAHVVLIGGLVRWSRATKTQVTQDVVWLNGGNGDGAVSDKTNLPKGIPVKPSPPVRVESKSEPPPREEPDEDRPALTSARSDIQLPTPRPSPKPSVTPARPPKPKPKPTVSSARTTKPKSKPTAKSSPKKTILAKASPKPSPKPTPEEADEKELDSGADAEKENTAKENLKQPFEKESPKKTPAAQSGGKAATPGTGGHAGGAGNKSQFSWYGSMLHDRFYSEWIQPTSIEPGGGKNSVLVKIRIEKDGRVSNFEIVRPSGNEALDESVNTLAKRITQVDPLPAGLGNGSHYDVKINFELNSE